MNIGIVGLGLIGGSMAKAAKKAGFTVWGTDLDHSIVLRAQLIDAIHAELTPARLKSCSVILLAIFPESVRQWLKEHAGRIAPGTMVIDCAGIKQEICRDGFALAKENRFDFLGGHPMAGIEKFGLAASQPNLFYHASMILVPPPHAELPLLAKAKDFFLKLGFGKITIASAEKHDRVIAFTSQLPHVIASAYVKSPMAPEHKGMSAGSYRDISRVATLQPEMWAELFLHNREELLEELDGFLAAMQQYRDAILDRDSGRLTRLLQDGSRIKNSIDR